MITECRIPGCRFDGECRAPMSGGAPCGWLSCDRKLCGPHATKLSRAWAAGLAGGLTGTEHDYGSHCIEPRCPACCCYIDPSGAAGAQGGDK